MSGRLALDTNVIVALLRATDPPDPHLLTLDPVIPLTAAGELFAGAYMSARRVENLGTVREFLRGRTILRPDLTTAAHYGSLRAHFRGAALTVAKTNDLWIAALCLQHDLPLLTSDRGFDSIPGLTVIHW